MPPAYTGEEKLVLAFDIGATHSAVAFAHLSDGIEPEFWLTRQWPGVNDGDCKFPTAIRYSASGTPLAFGAMAINPQEDLQPGSRLVHRFKLRLHSPEMLAHTHFQRPSLPHGITITKIYADFIRHCYKRTIKSFVDATPDGAQILHRLQSNVDLVFAVPNGWSQSQRAIMRRAIDLADILPQNPGPDRISFVFEAEASVHFVLLHTRSATSWMNPGCIFACLDAGGSTVDTTMYECVSLDPLKLVEVTGSECAHAGGVLVNQTFEARLRMKLANKRLPHGYAKEDFISVAMEHFETTAKRNFSGEARPIFMPLRLGRTFNDAALNLFNGTLRVPALEMQEAFQASINAIRDSLFRLFGRTEKKCSKVLIVGGFAESQYLRESLKTQMNLNGVEEWVSTIEPTKKAAAEGALAWYVQECVVARAARYTYGTSIDPAYNDNNLEHQVRRGLRFFDCDGRETLRGAFETLVKKNEVVSKDEPVAFPYFRIFHVEPTAAELSQWKFTLLSSDTEKPPYWAYDRDGKLTRGVQVVATLAADMTAMLKNVEMKFNRTTGRPYWEVSFQVQVFFGRADIEACMAWYEEDKLVMGPMTLVTDAVGPTKD